MDNNKIKIMQIKRAEFLTSSPSIDKCPDLNFPEIAVIGRSNVGKSSFINMLLGYKNISKVSSTPGKTQLLNFFLVNNNWLLIDLPGYGFAKVSKKLREKWIEMIEEYFLHRKKLICIFVLIDSRLNPQNNDLTFINWLGTNNLPLSIIFTKIDKINKIILNKNIKLFSSCLLDKFEYLPKILKISSKTKEGRTEVLDFIEQMIQ